MGLDFPRLKSRITITKSTACEKVTGLSIKNVFGTDVHSTYLRVLPAVRYSDAVPALKYLRGLGHHSVEHI